MSKRWMPKVDDRFPSGLGRREYGCRDESGDHPRPVCWVWSGAVGTIVTGRPDWRTIPVNGSTLRVLEVRCPTL